MARLASLNRISRGALLGGISGRPVVAADAVSYFVGATSLLKAARLPALQTGAQTRSS